MNTIPPLPRKCPGRVFLAPLLASALAASAAAQQSPYPSQNQAYPPPGYGYQQQRPGVGERVGGFVRRLFYGEPAPRQTSPYGYSQGRNLDSFPSPASSYQSPVASQPPASRPPATASGTPAKTASAPPKTTATRTQTSPPKTSPSPGSKYTPPKIQSGGASSSASKPAPTPSKPQSTPPAPAPKPEPKVEDQPPAPALDNTPTQPTTNLASLNKTLPDLDVPTIKQPNPPASSSSAASTPPSPSEPKDKAPAPATSSSGFLVGKKTAVPGRVISPYPPYQELDVTGLASGSLALDPTTDKVFEIP